jgi:hypothetical protein
MLEIVALLVEKKGILLVQMVVRPALFVVGLSALDK